MELGQPQLLAEVVQEQRLMQLFGKQLLGATDQAFTGCRAGGHAHAAEADHFAQQYNQGVFVQLTDQRVAA